MPARRPRARAGERLAGNLLDDLGDLLFRTRLDQLVDQLRRDKAYGRDEGGKPFSIIYSLRMPSCDISEVQSS